MKMLLRCHDVAVVWLLVAMVGCASQPEARIVRLVPSTDGKQIRFGLTKPHQDRIIPTDSLVDELTRLKLHRGDALFIQVMPSSMVERFWDSCYRMSEFFDANKIRWFYLSAQSAEDESIFAVPAYHWVSPYDNPNDLEHTYFFVEGKYLGTAMRGFDRMLHEIATTRPREIFLLQSNFSPSTGYAVSSAPWGDQYERWDKVIEKSGTRVFSP